MQTQKLIEIGSLRDTPANRGSEERETFPNIPVLPETLLSFELKIGGPYVDLAEVSRIVLTDVGAALQVLRLAERENASGSGLSRRIEDCISDLGLRRCVDAMAGRTAAWSAKRAAIRGAWVHAREIAEICAALSVKTNGRSEQDAYIVGLFHELGRLPDLLDWETTDPRPIDEDLIGLTLARSWSLPACTQQYFANRRRFNESCPWAELVYAAHQISSQPSISHSYRRDRSFNLIPGKSSHGHRSA